MTHVKRAFWGGLLLLSLLWTLAETSVFRANGLMALRDPMIQYTGILAIGCMSGAMILALRPRWPERWLGGLDKMYRLHKWLGIGALCLSVLHWGWSQGPKWAVGLGLIQRPVRGARVEPDDPIQAFFLSLRGPAEGMGEWAFYISVVLIALALIRFFPYRLFFKTHRILAFTYLVLAFHTVVLMKLSYWATPMGWVTGALLLAGIWAAIIVLLRRVGASRKVSGRIVALEYYPGVRSLETDTADARNANIGLHLLIDARDGRLTGQRIRDAVPNWREASIWFCGPAGFGEAIRKDFAAQGFPVAKHFHHELFDMR